MTYNVRFDNPEDAAAGHGWTERCGAVVDTVRRSGADIVGFQEARLNQLADLVRSLSGFRSVGKPRQAGVTGEYVPIFVCTERFDVTASGDFWLSVTPDVEASIGWDAPDPRHCTWATVRERHAGFEVAAFNTHLDVWGQQARVEGARLIAARRNIAGDLPCVVMGDFNAGEHSQPLDVLRAAGLRDTYRVVHPDGPAPTYHGFSPPPVGDKLDYVLCDDRWDVLDAFVVDGVVGDRVASDHLAVVADLTLRP
jgi:endonuclease/exonuclease/phosphatase family metal-dependent hydrolase